MVLLTSFLQIVPGDNETKESTSYIRRKSRLLQMVIKLAIWPVLSRQKIGYDLGTVDGRKSLEDVMSLFVLDGQEE